VKHGFAYKFPPQWKRNTSTKRWRLLLKLGESWRLLS